MRVVGGIWRGRELHAPQGRDTRPTTDRMRESIASAVLSERGLDLSGDAVLDAFAGSGAMGIELLSRGAASCTFCERDRRAAGVVRTNCREVVGKTAPWNVVVGDAMRIAMSPGMAGAPFSVVFLDPPYAMPAQTVGELVSTLSGRGHLAGDCLVVYERSSNAAGLCVPCVSLVRTKKHGGTCVDLYILEDL